MKRKQIIVLEITYENEDDGWMVPKSPPSKWDWPRVLNEPGPITVIAGGPDLPAEGDPE